MGLERYRGDNSKLHIKVDWAAFENSGIKLEGRKKNRVHLFYKATQFPCMNLILVSQLYGYLIIQRKDVLK